MVFMGFSGGMLLFLARMDESLVPHQQITAGKGLCTDFADEGFLFGVGSDVPLEMFLLCDHSRQSAAEAIGWVMPMRVFWK